MDPSYFTERQYELFVGMFNLPTPVRDPDNKIILPVLTKADVKTELVNYEDTASARSDEAVFVQWGIPPAHVFPGATRPIQLKNRAIAWIGEKTGNDPSEMYATNQDVNDNKFLCLRCNITLQVITKNPHVCLSRHEGSCTGRNFCNKCFMIYSSEAGFLPRSNHKRGCKEEHEFNAIIVWLGDPIPNSE